MGLLAMAILASLLIETPAAATGLRDRFPNQSLPLLAVGATLAAHAGWAALGIGLGAVYWAIRDDAQSGAGSPAWGFSLAIAGLALLVVVFAIAARVPATRRLALLALVFTGVFGWLLPNLAEA